MSLTTHTSPISPPPGLQDQSVSLAVPAEVHQVGGTNSRAGEAQGTISARIEFKKSWLVTVEFLTGFRKGEVVQYRWYREADAIKCKRDFSWRGPEHNRVTVQACTGYITFEGWVDA